MVEEPAGVAGVTGDEEATTESFGRSSPLMNPTVKRMRERGEVIREARETRRRGKGGQGAAIPRDRWFLDAVELR